MGKKNKSGHWELLYVRAIKNGSCDVWVRCSRCGITLAHEQDDTDDSSKFLKYCSNCGANMHFPTNLEEALAAYSE